MEYRHIIFLYSDFSSGKRIGLHFLYEEGNIESINTMNEVIKKDDNISVYSITNNNKKVRSLAKTDAFYKGIRFFDGSSQKDIGDFLNLVRINSKTKIKDLLFLILTRKRCSFLELTIYFYFSYCLYTIENKKMPTNEKIICDNFGIDLSTFMKNSVDRSFQQDKTINFLNKDEAFSKISSPPFAEINPLNRRKVNAIFSNSTSEYNAMVKFIGIIDKVISVPIEILYDNMIENESVYFKVSHSDSKHLTTDKILKSSAQIKKVFKF